MTAEIFDFARAQLFKEFESLIEQAQQDVIATDAEMEAARFTGDDTIFFNAVAKAAAAVVHRAYLVAGKRGDLNPALNALADGNKKLARDLSLLAYAQLVAMPTTDGLWIYGPLLATAADAFVKNAPSRAKLIAIRKRQEGA